MNTVLEVACFTIAGAITAQRAGANRLEFCENPYEGGTTPSYGALKTLEKFISIPVFPIIRPRGGDFLYSEAEYEVMKHDVILCRSLGYEGVVIGLLNEDGSIDQDRTSELVTIAYPMEVTFHRAFDRCKDPIEGLEKVIACGCQRILTSGQFPVVSEGENLLRQLVEAASERIIILPGSGVNSKNILDLAKNTGAKEFHSSARIPNYGSMKYYNVSMQENLSFMDVDETEVKAMLQQLKSV